MLFPQPVIFYDVLYVLSIKLLVAYQQLSNLCAPTGHLFFLALFEVYAIGTANIIFEVVFTHFINNAELNVPVSLEGPVLRGEPGFRLPEGVIILKIK